MKQKAKIPVPKVIKGYLSYLSSIKGTSQQTVRAYTYDLILFFRFLKIYYGDIDENTPFEEIDIMDINIDFIKDIDLSSIYGFLSFLEDDRGCVGSTRARKVACLKSFFNYAHKRAKFLDYDLGAELETPKIQKKVPIYLNIEESQKLIRSVKSRNTVRDRCIIVLFLNTGMRLSELCGINISSIKDDSLVITGKGNKQRVVFLNEICLKYINEYLIVRAEKAQYIVPEDKDALFISEQKKRINKRTVEDVVNNAIKNAGLSNKYSVHKLRHTAATLLFRSGADIRTLQSILGHENISTTQIYVHVDQDKMREAVKLNPLNL